jgi:hypothetical protein
LLDYSDFAGGFEKKMVNHENEIDPSQASSPSQSSNLNSMPNPSNIPSMKINLSDSFDQEMKMLPQSLATSKLESNNLVFTPMFNKKQETITEYAFLIIIENLLFVRSVFNRLK